MKKNANERNSHNNSNKKKKKNGEDGTDTRARDECGARAHVQSTTLPNGHYGPMSTTAACSRPSASAVCRLRRADRQRTRRTALQHRRARTG